MNWTGILLFASGGFAAVLAISALIRESRSVAQFSFFALMVLLAGEAIAQGLAVGAVSTEQARFHASVSLGISSLLPVAWLFFSLSYARGNAPQFLARWQFVLLAALVLPIAVWFLPGAVIREVGPAGTEGDSLIALGPNGVLLKALRVVASALALINLERTFRAATGTMRWRIKYLILGCGVVLGTTIYSSSQSILYAGVKPSILEVQSTARLVGYALIAFSLFRTRLAEIEIYPSQAFLYRSLTALFAGGYLLLVGILGKVAGWFGGDQNLPLKAFIALVSLVGLAIVLMSDRIRLQAQRTISRHLRRPLHDYRKVWMLFAERTSSLVTREDLCREVARLVSETFNVLSVTVFLVDDQNRQLLFGASTSLPENQANSILQALTSVDALTDWKRNSDPVDLDASTELWVRRLKELNPDHFDKGGSRIGVPLVASGQLLGLLTLTDRVSGIPFSSEDFDLLKCVGGQTAASLLNIKLSTSLVRSKELEAFQTMSTFFVHDLKNTALMLSLMLENLPVHFANPEFREDSLRSISKTVARINDLISRLSQLREGLKISPVETDLNKIVQQTLGPFQQLPGVELVQNLEPLPSVLLDPEQVQKVVTNLVLNARDALSSNGQIRVGTSRSNGWAVLQVADNGCGISPEFIGHSLFRPFQTTKKKGIGIGMYQSRMIVEAHAGRIEVESELGKGTTFKIFFPIKATK